jgi:hypothetical protein
MNKKQLALKIIEKLIELKIDFSYTGRTVLVNDPVMIGSDDLGDIVITDSNVYFDEWDSEYTVNNEEDLKRIYLLWDED